MSSLREPGSTLDGKYEIVQRLGSGGMGEVYLVRHIHLQELRVIKILRQDLQTDPAAQKRFMREARLATQIKHPNVAILYDFATLPDEGSFYMVWEHIQGEDVGDWIRRNGPFPVPLAIRLGIQALRGLESIHATGVIHRDLSPDNLMITEDKQGQKRI
ncbi:MAG: serine/threonine protein kinase, partial [Thermoanaerobaculia bacterium]